MFAPDQFPYAFHGLNPKPQVRYLSNSHFFSDSCIIKKKGGSLQGFLQLWTLSLISHSHFLFGPFEQNQHFSLPCRYRQKWVKTYRFIHLSINLYVYVIYLSVYLSFIFLDPPHPTPLLTPLTHSSHFYIAAAPSATRAAAPGGHTCLCAGFSAISSSILCEITLACVLASMHQVSVSDN